MAGPQTEVEPALPGVVKVDNGLAEPAPSPEWPYLFPEVC